MKSNPIKFTENVIYYYYGLVKRVLDLDIRTCCTTCMGSLRHISLNMADRKSDCIYIKSG